VVVARPAASTARRARRRFERGFQRDRRPSLHNLPAAACR